MEDESTRDEQAETATRQKVKKHKCPCPACGGSNVVRNGRYQSKYYGLVERFICQTCGHLWNEKEIGSNPFADAHIPDTQLSIFQAFALVALGLPLDQVEALVNRKAETIKARLMRCFDNQRTWNQIKETLVSFFKVEVAEVKALSALLEKIKDRHATFHATCRRKAAANIRPRKYSSAKEKKEIHDSFFKGEPITSISNEQREILAEKQIRRPKPVTENVKAARNILNERIENVLDERVIATSDGDFYRLSGDPRVFRMLQRVKKFPFDIKKDSYLYYCIGPIGLLIFDHVRSQYGKPNIYAMLEEIHGQSDNSKGKVTFESLAQCIGMTAEEFIVHLKSVAERLGNPKKHWNLDHCKTAIVIPPESNAKQS